MKKVHFRVYLSFGKEIFILVFISVYSIKDSFPFSCFLLLGFICGNEISTPIINLVAQNKIRNTKIGIKQAVMIMTAMVSRISLNNVSPLLTRSLIPLVREERLSLMILPMFSSQLDPS